MAKRLSIITYPNPVLRKVAEDVQENDIPQLQDFIDDMILTMKEADGIGLAAPQVNTSLQLVVIEYKDGPLIFINPKLTKFSFRKDILEEGCLSIPKVYGTVKRSIGLHFSALNRNGKPFSGRAEGMLARVLQHEVDHLNGVLFIDRIKQITQGEMPKNV